MDTDAPHMVFQSSENLTGVCPHFGECGGCSYQDKPYPEQVRAKGRMLEQLFSEFWHGPIQVEPSPVVWFYRNRADLTFAPKWYNQPPAPGFERETVLGYRRKGRWFWPLDVAECRIFSPELPALLDAVKRWFRAARLQAYDERTQQGILRGLLVREGKRTGQRLVVLITREGEFDAGVFVEAVRAACSVTSIFHGIYRGRAQVTCADELHLLFGPPEIAEELHVVDDVSRRRFRFCISPFSFFQTNTMGADVLYTRVREWVKGVVPSILYDLYGGSGGIALSCADLVPQVVSVENVLSTTRDATRNAVMNRIENARFTTNSVEDFLMQLLRRGELEKDAAVIVDPPRAGLHPRALKALLELKPAHLLYVSCKPSTLVLELPKLLEVFRLRSLHAVDMFPHTDHVEVLAEFSL
ncbi:MAG: 23S rRNA (uracil(1939)-C(5))-methyltransferase RlmD [Candidatus Hydrogenedentes bacterium]|nr:23S rRNA (uracil(1939)-C(5))-methyltransferase RlmD [Candidatus Hydrogenedentota bacterium]